MLSLGGFQRVVSRKYSGSASHASKAKPTSANSDVEETLNLKP